MFILRKKVVRFLFGVVCFSLVLTVTCPAIAGQLFTWTGAGDGVNWGDRFNWNPNDRYPDGDGDSALIGNGISVIFANVMLGRATVSELELGLGATLTLIDNKLNLTSSTGTATLTNDGTIHLAGNNWGTYLSCGTTQVTVGGAGKILLAGSYNHIEGSSPGGLIQETPHRIEGAGNITCPLFNRSLILANNGLMVIYYQDLDNTGGILAAGGSGNVLQLNQTPVKGGQINPQDGAINFFNSPALLDVAISPGTVEGRCTIGGNSSIAAGVQWTDADLRFENNESRPNVITNNTVITSGYIYAVGPSTLTGTGRFVMDGGSVMGEWEDVPLIQETGHTIEGRGDITYCYNKGTLKANNGTLSVRDGVTNQGVIQATATLEVSAKITGDGPIQILAGGALVVTGGVGDFPFDPVVMNANSMLTVNGSLDLKKNFTFLQTDPTKWSFDTWSYIQMSGGGTVDQSVEVGGQDMGAVAAGFTDNFNPSELRLSGAGTYAYLADNVDNGHRLGKPEAMYASRLEVPPGTTLNLNSLNLYVNYFGTPRLVVPQEAHLYGGGTIIDAHYGPGGRNITGVLPLLLN